MKGKPGASLGDASEGRRPTSVMRGRKRRGGKGRTTHRLRPEAYRGRDVVERSLNTFKRWRGLANRYDTARGLLLRRVVLASVTIWLRH